MSTATLSPATLLQGVARLSVGSIVVQGLGALSQIAFAYWLSPVDFGYWAAASSALLVVSGLVNLGEVNGFLAHPEKAYRATRAAIWRFNAVLMVVGLGVAAGYAVNDRLTVAALMALIALNLPLLGHTNLVYAASVRCGERRALIRAQLTSAVLRAGLGLTVAAVTGSAVAFAVSMIVYSLTMIVVLDRRAAERTSGGSADPSWSPAVRQRVAWSAQTLSQTLPTQIDFLVVSFVAAPALLGIYFLSYQATVALSSLLVAPLVASVVSTLAGMGAEQRQRFALTLVVAVTSLLGVGVCIAIPVVEWAGGLLPVRWADAAPTVAVLLISLPARFVAPLADSLLMAERRWWVSTRVNVLDAIGTGAAALVAVTGDVSQLALAVVGWKICFAVIRLQLVLPGLRARQRLAPVVPMLTVAAALLAGFALRELSPRAGAGWLYPAATGLPLVLALVWCAVPLAVRRRHQRGARVQD